MNLEAATQAANAIDLAIRAGGVQVALANIDLLVAIAKAAKDEQDKKVEAETPVAQTARKK